MEKKTRNDIILIAVLLVAALAGYLGIRFYQDRNTVAGEAVVTLDGTVYGTYPLNKDVTEKIELPDGAYNILVIRDGEADITEASCPDGICVKHSAIRMQNESIVCLPNKMVVEIKNGEISDLDGVVK